MPEFDDNPYAYVGIFDTCVVSVDLSSPARTITVPFKGPPDGGFGWVVVLSSFLISFIISGFLKSFDAFRACILSEFPGMSPSAAAWIFDEIGTLSLITTPVASVLTTTYGFRTVASLGSILCSFGLVLSYFATSGSFLFGSFGILTSVGVSFAFTSSVVCIGKYFTTKLPCAMALGFAGGSLGAMVLPTGINAILHALGIRCTFLVMSGIFTVIFLCSLAFEPPEDHFVTLYKQVPVDESICEVEGLAEPQAAESERFVTIAEVVLEKLALRFLADRSFLLTACSVFATGMGCSLLSQYVTEQAEANGVSVTNLLGYAGFGSLIARLSYCLLASRSPFLRSAVYAAALIFSASTVTLWPFCRSFAPLAIASTISGIGTGISTLLVPLLLETSYGAENLNKTFALVRFFQGVSALIAPSVGRYLTASFCSEAVVLLAGGLISTAAALGTA